MENKIINEHSFAFDSNGKKWTEYDTIKCLDGQVIDMRKLLADQERAKAALVHLQPFFAGFISKLHPVYTFRVETQGTDGYYLFINPQFTYNLDFTGKVFVLAHEIMHNVLNHMRRGKAHNHFRSNIAADYECNITLSDDTQCGMGICKFSTIKKITPFVDHKFADWGYEKIYDYIGPQSGEDMRNQQGQQGNQNQQNNQNQQGQQGNQSQQGNQQNGSGSGSNNQKQSADFIKGWNKAMEDYKKGKVKIKVD